jgi:lipopolysaccharide exporter
MMTAGHPPPEGESVPPAPTSALAGRVMRGALWSGANTILLRLGNIVIMAIVVRIVTPEDFGVFAVAVSVHAVIVTIGGLGLLTVMARADTDQDAIAPTVKTLALLGCLLAAAGLFLASGFIASALGAPDASNAIKVMSLAVVLVGVYAIPGAIVARELRQDRLFFANMLAFGPTNALLILLALHGDGALAFAWSRVFGQLLVGLVLTYFVTQRYRFGFSRRQARFLLAAGLPMAAADLLGVFLINVDYVFIANRLGTHQLGLYVLAFNVANWSTWVLGAVLAGVGVATFSRVAAEGQLENWVCKAQQSVAFLAWPFCALSAVSARPLIETIYGSTWVNAALILAILAPYAVLLTHTLVFAQVLYGTGHGRKYFLIQAIWLAVLIPGLWCGAALGDTTGVALAHVVIICCVVMPLHLRTIYKVHKVRARTLFVAVFPALPGVLAACGADFAVSAAFDRPWQKLIAGLLAGGVAYVIVSAPRLKGVLPQTNGRGALGRVHAVLDVADRPRQMLITRLGPSRRARTAPGDDIGNTESARKEGHV